MLTMMYPTSSAEISYLHKRARAGNREARERVARHWDQRALCTYSEAFLQWAMGCFVPHAPNKADPLQSDYTLEVAWRAWQAGTIRGCG